MDDYSDPSGCRYIPPPKPVRRCPIGNKAERTKPIIPIPSIHPVTVDTVNRTTYESEYYARRLEKTPSYGPRKVAFRSVGEFEINSAYRTEFPPYKVEPFKQANWKHDREYKPSSEPMILRSSYDTNFQRKVGLPAISCKPRIGPEINPPLLDDLSSYKMNYVWHRIPKKPAKKTREEMFRDSLSNCPKMDGVTTYKKDYVKTRPCPSVSAKPEYRRPKGMAAFDDRTVYRCAYEPYYYDNEDCLPPEEYDARFPPKGKCDDVMMYPDSEPIRVVPEPVVPTPPCPCPKTPFKCPSPYELRCAPRVVPCVSPYKIKSFLDDYGTTHITLDNNTKGDLRAGKPAEVVCPKPIVTRMEKQAMK